MSKNIGRKLACALLFLLLAGTAGRAFASSPGPSQNPPSTSTTSPTPDGITGTDPEPIDPGIVSIILTLFGLG